VETPINVPDCLESELKREKKAIDKRETPEPTDPQELTPLEKLKKQLNKIEGEPTESRKEDAWKEFLNSADWKNATNVTKRKIEDFEEYIKLKELYDINN